MQRVPDGQTRDLLPKLLKLISQRRWSKEYQDVVIKHHTGTTVLSDLTDEQLHTVLTRLGVDLDGEAVSA